MHRNKCSRNINWTFKSKVFMPWMLSACCLPNFKLSNQLYCGCPDSNPWEKRTRFALNKLETPDRSQEKHLFVTVLAIHCGWFWPSRLASLKLIEPNCLYELSMRESNPERGYVEFWQWVRMEALNFHISLLVPGLRSSDLLINKCHKKDTNLCY